MRAQGRIARPLRQVGGWALLGLLAARCALTMPTPRHQDLSERLRAIPTRGLPLRGLVVIHWNQHQVPFIEADHDEDLPVALGLVHAHLRLAQMELLRRIGQGRLSEMLGPIMIDVDHALRILNYGRAVPAIVAALPGETRRWLEGFVAGINHYLTRVAALPYEFAVLGLKREPWTIAEVLTLGRLASTDVTWLVWLRLVGLRHHPDWPEICGRLTGGEVTPSIPSVGLAADPGPAFWTVLSSAARSGSNAVAVSATRSATGAPLLAGDSHLPIILPNLWLIAGFRSPSYHAAGLMIPGLPIIALGRNPWIAWGGTNLHAASTDLYELSSMPKTTIHTRRESIAVRWAAARTVTIRESDFGPIISDAPPLRPRRGQALALRWVGHLASDEITAMLRLARARDWDEFRAALEGFAVPGQTMLYADAAGHIGEVMAARLPCRPAAELRDPFIPAADAAHWQRLATSRDLPCRLDPPEGYLVSANNRPKASEIAIGYFFSPDDRALRLAQLIDQRASVSVECITSLHRDVYHRPAVTLRDWIIGRIRARSPAPHQARTTRRFLEALSAWDGGYEAGSAGALAFELLLHYLSMRVCGATNLRAYEATWRTRGFIARDLAAASDKVIGAALDQALPAAAERLDAFETWGGMHRLRLAHPLGGMPLVGRRFRYGDVPVSGSSETLMKTAHPLTDERHAATYGSNARYICDLSDPDRSYFVLLGGQDGWLGSSTSVDQCALWQRGEYIQVPLKPEFVRARFPYQVELLP